MVVQMVAMMDNHLVGQMVVSMAVKLVVEKAEKMALPLVDL